MARLLGNTRNARIGIIAILLIALSGCASAKYSALEKVGIHKRDLLVDGVEDARDAQSETREQLVTAYEELSALIGHDGGKLEEKYKRLSKEVEQSQDSIEDLDDHLADIDRVSKALFDEWKDELDLYNNAALRADQAKKLAQARRQFSTMRDRMQTARDRVDPVMAVLSDNVLYLKHSLNAQALDALRGQATTLEGQVDALIRDMQIAIEEADAFIARMRNEA
jgi:chromosome segregation ATPase